MTVSEGLKTSHALKKVSFVRSVSEKRVVGWTNGANGDDCIINLRCEDAGEKQAQFKWDYALKECQSSHQVGECEKGKGEAHSRCEIKKNIYKVN